MDYSKLKKVHIIGIEGGGTSALACLYHNLGLTVSGSDKGDHFFQSLLQDKGISLFSDFSPANLPIDADLVVYSTAFRPETNSELASALSLKNTGVRVLSYPEALADLFNQRLGIAVCGSHGKTTTSAWLAWVMIQAGLKPSFIIGAKVPQLAEENSAGQSDYLLIEADEYQNKLQYYLPKMALLNNIDYDHPDFFSDPLSYEQAFADFVAKLPASGWLVANYDSELVKEVVKKNCLAKIISYGLENQTTDYSATDLNYFEGEQSFLVKKAGEDLGIFTIKLLGKHNISNALAVISASLELGISLEDLKKHLASFTGTVRRLQELGQFAGAIILDDFAHHPTEIKATLEAVRQKYPQAKLRVVFHPHTFSRTKALFNDFLDSFNLADELIILDIYGSARETQGGVSSEELVEKMRLVHEGKDIKYLPSLAEAENYLRSQLKAGEILLLVGAGDVFQIGLNLIK